MRRRIEPDPDKSWEVASSGFQVGPTLYMSGQVGLDDDGKVAGNDIHTQAEKALENIRAILEAAGGHLRDIVHLTLYFTDAADSAGYFEVARRFFPTDPPPATGVVVNRLLLPDLLIEINAIAVLPDTAQPSADSA
jgi:2-iminobutanoate/2-iminopropanoate deaminase